MQGYAETNFVDTYEFGADLNIVGSRAALFYDGKLKINNCGFTVKKAGKA